MSPSLLVLSKVVVILVRGVPLWDLSRDPRPQPRAPSAAVSEGWGWLEAPEILRPSPLPHCSDLAACASQLCSELASLL